MGQVTPKKYLKKVYQMSGLKLRKCEKVWQCWENVLTVGKVLKNCAKSCESVQKLRKKRKRFQIRLLVQVTNTFQWLKSTLFLKIECWETHIYMKTECLQT